jgi:nucleoside-diphosphate-sugar epimerase
VLAAAESPCDGLVMHVAAGVETTIRELGERMLAITGATVPIEWRPARAGEVRRNFARIERAREVLGYAPAWSLDAGLRATWAWFQQARA